MGAVCQTHPKSKQIFIRVEKNDDAILGEKSSLVELFVILLDNAIKYSPEKTTISISLKKTDGKIQITVADEGIGIATKDLPHVFDRFYRGDPARVRSEGAGLGLSIARWIAEAHSAQIHVRSGEREGTRVEVSFPRTAENG